MGQGSGRYNSITSIEKELVYNSWMELRSQLRDFGVDLFLLMVNDYPHFANYWAFTRENTNSFELFVKQFMLEFDLLVQNLYRPSKLNLLLYHNAVYHVKKNIPKQDYDRLRKCIVSTIGEHIGVTASKRKEILSAWVKVLSICFSFITDMIDDLIAEEPKSADPS